MFGIFLSFYFWHDWEHALCPNVLVIPENRIAHTYSSLHAFSLWFCSFHTTLTFLLCSNCTVFKLQLFGFFLGYRILGVFYFLLCSRESMCIYQSSMNLQQCYGGIVPTRTLVISKLLWQFTSFNEWSADTSSTQRTWEQNL